MSDDFEQLRRLRPDHDAEQPTDPDVLSQEKERLMSTIDDTYDYTALRTPDVYPRLAYLDERAALDYLVRVYGFAEIREARMEWGGHILAWLRLGNGIVMIGHANHDVHHIYSPREVGQSTTIMNVRVHGIEVHYAHAVAEGADITMELEDAFYGERRYEATDLEGHRWHFSESFADIKARGGDVPDSVEEDC